MKKLCSKQNQGAKQGRFSLVFFPTFLIFIPASKFSLKLQKLIQEKLKESEKQARTKINLIIRENLKRKIKEMKIN